MKSENKDKKFEDYLILVRDFTNKILIPNEEILEDQGMVDKEIMLKIKELGLFGISIPNKYGGLGFDMEEQVLLTFEFTRASSVYRSRFSTTIGLCSQALLDFGTTKQKENILPPMARGDLVGAFALTEPNAGSDANAIETTAIKENDNYVLNGTKKYITNAPYADIFLVMAKTDNSFKGSKGISSFLVDAKLPGIQVGKIPKLLGQRGSAPTDINFTDCVVPADSLLGGQEGGGLKPALRGINHARLHVAATCVGQAQRLIEEAIKFAKSRNQFNMPISEMPSIQNMLADSFTEMVAAKAMTLEAARNFDKGEIPEVEISAAKYFASEMVTRVADNSVQIMGGAGFIDDNVITRFYRDTRLFRLYEGTSQIQQRNIARKIIKVFDD